MTVSEILQGLIYGDLPRSVEVFGPEIVLCVTVVSLLLLRLFNLDRTVPPYVVALFGALLGFVGVLAQFVYYTTVGGATGSVPLVTVAGRSSISIDGHREAGSTRAVASLSAACSRASAEGSRDFRGRLP